MNCNNVNRSFVALLSIFFIVSCKSYDVRMLEAMSESGDHKAQGNLGFMYQYGYGVRANYNESLKWYKLAASDGDPLAEGTVGRLYFEKQDYKNALPWFKKCALHDIQSGTERKTEQAILACQGMVGTMYLYGQGVPVNKPEAKVWLKKAADQGEGSAQCYVGDFYYLDRDYKSAYPYLQRALEKGCANAAKYLSDMYSNGFFVEKDSQRAKELYEKYLRLKSYD